MFPSSKYSREVEDRRKVAGESIQKRILRGAL
jgi:hypothetical protein